VNDELSTGVASEYAVASELSNIGHVSIPQSRPRYDLIVDFDSTLYRVQVKTAYQTGQRNDAHVVHTHGGTYSDPTHYEEDEFDILAVYERESMRTAYIPWIKENIRETISVWFKREVDDFRPCNRGMVNIAGQLTFHDAIESLKSK
jgi:hypothetical protein